MKREVIKLISNLISWIDFTLEDNFQFKISRHVIFKDSIKLTVTMPLLSPRMRMEGVGVTAPITFNFGNKWRLIL
jgi:hypothetical protein